MASASVVLEFKQTKPVIGYFEAVMHIVKQYIGTGIFSMGHATKNAGLLLGPLCILSLGLICLHCCHLLVNTARSLYEKNDLEFIPGYAETSELCFSLGAPSLRSTATVVRIVVNTFLITTQITACACYLVFVASNIQEVMKVHNKFYNIHLIILFVIVPIWLTCLIRTLKWLAPLSVITNIFLLLSILIVLYYAFCLPANSNEATIKPTSIANFALSFGEILFALNGIQLILIVYSEMGMSEKFDGICGVLNVSLFIVAGSYAIFGFLCYLQFGKYIKETVTLNLKGTEWLGETVLVLVSIEVMFSFSIQLYIVVDILWPKIMDKYGPFNYPTIAEFMFRTALVAFIFLLGEAVPKLDILMSLIGSFLSVPLTIVFPAIMDLTTFYSLNKLTKFVFIKDTLIIALGILSTAACTYESLVLIGDIYQ